MVKEIKLTVKENIDFDIGNSIYRYDILFNDEVVDTFAIDKYNKKVVTVLYSKYANILNCENYYDYLDLSNLVEKDKKEIEYTSLYIKNYFCDDYYKVVHYFKTGVK